MDEGIGNAAGELYLNFHLCDKKEDVVVDEQAKGAHTVFSNNNIIVRTITDDNFIKGATRNGRVSFSSSAGDGYNERTAYYINSNKKANETTRFITVILPVDKYTGNEEIKATFGECTDNSVSVNVTVEGETKTLSYTL